MDTTLTTTQTKAGADSTQKALISRSLSPKQSMLIPSRAMMQKVSFLIPQSSLKLLQYLTPQALNLSKRNIRQRYSNTL